MLKKISERLNTVKTELLVACMVLLPMCFASCASLQQDLIRFSETDIEYIQIYEETLVKLDSLNFQGDNSEEFQNECRDFINTVQNQISTMGMNNAVLSRLYSLQGRAYLLSGKKSKAQDCYKKAVKSYKGDAQGIILSYRLGITTNLDDANIVSICNDKALLTLEKALTYYKEGDLGRSAALFDDAFISLDPMYKTYYGTLRDIAWDLRDISYITQSKPIQKLLTKNSLKTGEFLLLMQEVSTFLDPITNGKTLKEAELYKKAAANVLLSSVSGLYGNVVTTKDEVLTRITCARLMWNFYTDKKSIEAAKYSEFYREMSVPSPIADLDIEDDDFDAVLGCVENEIINMTDGVYFHGQEVPSAIEICRMIQLAESR